MKKNVKEIEIKLTSEWTESLDEAFKEKQKDVKVDGFRKGAVPKDVYIKKFGIESLYMDAVDNAINKAYVKVLEENEITPIIEPSVDITGISDSNIIVKFTITTRPEIKLGEYKNLGIKKEKAKVTAEEIDAEIKKVQDSMADLVVKESGEVALKDTAIIDFKGVVDGKPLEGGSGENYSLEIGSGMFIPGFEEGLIGKKVGETVTLDLKFPSEYVENLKDKEVTFEVKINEVKTRVVPEIDEEFFKDLGYDDVKTIDDLKAKTKEYLLHEKEHHMEDHYIDECLAKAIENMKVDINEEIIDSEIHRMIHELEGQIAQSGMNLAKYYELTGTNEETLHKNFEPEALKRLKARFLLDEVASVENIEFTEKEVKAKAKEMAENYGISEEELIKAYGNYEVIKYDMKMHKALEIIKENK